MSQTAALPVVHDIRKWLLSRPIPLRGLLAAQSELVTPVLHAVQL
jgi:hypothetical protein